MKRETVLIATMALLGGAVTTSLMRHLDSASADVPPVAQRLFYSGVLIDGTTPVTGQRNIGVRFFDMAVGGTQLCAAPIQQVDVTQGAFRANVSTCGDELAGAIDAFVQVEVGVDTIPPIGVARPRVGAVPYAAQALSATQAATLSAPLPATAVSTSGTTVEARLNTLQLGLDPVGSTISYAGSTAPTGWLLCDGTAVSRTTYAALYAVVGDRFGIGDGSTTFNLPDLRGRFVRGWSNQSTNDPDRFSRIAMNPGGATGNNVGSVQGDATAKNGLALADPGHSHVERGNGNTQGGTAITNMANGDRESASSTNPATSNITLGDGDAETRPLNVYLNFIIKH